MNNKFDEKYDIRIAFYDEIPEIMEFIDANWKKGHILATNRNFFEYEMVVDGNVNFIIAKERERGTIEGVLGFLPCSRSKEKVDIWGAIWKTTPGAMPMLGMELKKRLISITGMRTDIGVGANPRTTVPLLGRVCHYYTAKMKHYYRLANIADYKIAKVAEKNIAPFDSNKPIVTKEILNIEQLNDFFDFETVADMIPYKDSWYYNKRFFMHPIYKYKVWGLECKESKALLITRVQECNGRSAIRIVDYIGDQELFGGCGAFLETLLEGNEYIDFYFDGFNEEYLKQAGMTDIDTYNNIIPNYFNPFEQRNIDIYVVSSNNKDRCTFFLADADQDRPG